MPQWFWSELPCLRQLFCSLLQDNPLVRLISEVVGLGPGPDPSWVELRPMGLKSRLGRFLLSNSERKEQPLSTDEVEEKFSIALIIILILSRLLTF